MPTQFDDAFIEIRVDKRRAEEALDEIDRGRGPGETSRRRRDGRSREQRERDKRRRESRKENKKLLRLGKRAGQFALGGAAGAGSIAILGQLVIPVVRRILQEELGSSPGTLDFIRDPGKAIREKLIHDVLNSDIMKETLERLETLITAGLNDLSDLVQNIAAGIETLETVRNLALLDPDSISVQGAIDAFHQTRKYKKFQARLNLYNAREGRRAQTAVLMRMFGGASAAQ